MKLYKKILAAAAAILALGAFTGCESDPLQEVKDLVLNRCLEPMNLSAKISQGQTVTFGWDVTKDADQYSLVIYSDEAMTQVVKEETLLPDQVPYTIYLDVDKSYYFKVQAHSNTRNDSKWAEYGKAVKTYAVKDNLYLKVTDRTANSISFSWNADPEVDRIEYSVLGSEEFSTYSLTAEDIAAGTATVPELAPSTQYDVVLYFSSANRGELAVWTMPDMSALTPVKNDAELAQAIKDGANILVKMEGSPYTIATGELGKGLDVVKGFKLYGEEDPDGTKPVIYGSVNITDTFDGTDLYFEGIEFNGKANACGFLIQHKEGSTTDGVAVNSIIYKNCTVKDFSKGLFYEWGKTLAIGEFTFESCDINSVNVDGTVGGDGFDVRQATSISKLNFLDNTIYNSFRTFLRIDANPVIGDVRVENNTIMNICFVDNTNNGGIIAFQTVPSSFSLKNNLFLNMVEKTTMTSANTKYVTGEALSIAAQNNYFYNCHEGLFTTNFTLANASGKILSTDPCFNAKGGLFNIVKDSEISGMNIGASKWWVEYVEEPEDLTLETITGAKTWDFSNARYFSSDFTKSKVRDQLLFNVASNKITVADGVIGFTTATVGNKKGVPQDGYLAFQVDQPGSVIVKPVDDNNTTNHIIVGVGPKSGATVTVKGGASALTDMGNAQKIVISDITEETIVYVYASGKIGLSQLAWSTDISAVNTALPAPQPECKPSSVTEGEATAIEITWAPVENADSYSVVFNGKTYPVEEGTSYTIESTVVGFLGAGSYKVQVYANPGKNDIYNTASEAGVAAFAILPKADSGESKEFVVKNSEELLNAISAGKSEITLAAGNYEIGALTVSAPLSLKGQAGSTPKVTGAFTVSGEFANLNIDNLAFEAGDQAIFITVSDATTGNEIKVNNSSIKGYPKGVIYSNYAGASIENVTFNNVVVSNIGTGQGAFDFRKGTFGTINIQESTIENGCRDFIRCDSSVSVGYINIKNNTINAVSIDAANSILYVRTVATGSYTVANNLILNETGTKTILAKAGTQVPHLSSNFYYNCASDAFWTGTINQETAVSDGGVVLTTDPVKNASNGDYTLVNGLAMSCKVGASRWNPTADFGPSSSYEVSSADELKAALSAGKTEITLKAGTYETGAINAVAGLRLQANGDATIKGYLDIAGENLGQIVIDGVNFAYDGTNANAINVSAASTATSLTVKNATFDGFTKSVFYDGTGLTAASIKFNNVLVKNQGTGQGVFDKRKGAVTTFSIEQSTITGGRDLVRSDANTITGAFNFNNNTVNGSNLGVNGNGIMYVRASGISYSFKNNLFLNEVADGKTVLLSKAAGVTIPTAASNNFFYNVAESFFTGLFTEEVVGAVKLSSSPVKDADNGNYTLTDALCLSSNVGAARWNPNSGTVSSEITVTNATELLNAIAVGKTAITLAYGQYDLTAITDDPSVSTGVLTLTKPIALIGKAKGSAKPVVIGSLKLSGAEMTSFSATGIAFNGNAKALGIAIEIPDAIQAKISVKDCDIYDYSKSVVYGNGVDSAISSLTLSGLLVHDMGTGQGTIDLRKGTYDAIIIEKSTFYNGGRDFIRCDANVGKSIAITNNTFSNVSIDAANSILYVRSEIGDKYVVKGNLFLNETGTKTILAKSNAMVPAMSGNYFYNCSSEAFWTGKIDKETATANGAVLEADPCTSSAENNFKVTDATVKAAKAGDPRWL